MPGGIYANGKPLFSAMTDAELDGEIARVNFEYLTYGIPNKEILDLTDNPILNPPAEVLAKCETLANLGSDGDDMYSRYWKLFKAK